jgi:hypothetical protein
MTQATHTISVESSGEDLAQQLQQWRDAIQSGHRGADRPPYAAPGLPWVKEVSGTNWQLYFCGNATDGSKDALVGSYNPTTGTITLNIPIQGVVKANSGDAAAGALIDKLTAIDGISVAVVDVGGGVLKVQISHADGGILPATLATIPVDKLHARSRRAVRAANYYLYR